MNAKEVLTPGKAGVHTVFNNFLDTGYWRKLSA
jgi:hypothetical protein